MKLRYKIGIGFLSVIGLAIVALAITLSYESECPEPGEAFAGPGSMKAWRYDCYGGPGVLSLENVERPAVGEGEVLVRVHAAGVNPYDWHFMRGKPYFMRLMSGIGAPDDPRLGVDFSGTVEAVGSGVTKFLPGEEVFGGATGAFGEYLVISEDRGVALKPANISFEQAASVGIAGVTALQAIRDVGGLQPGQRVLINGASGGVGTFAVQIARAIGAEVTGVCSTRNVDMVRALGADHVIDYTQENFTESGERYDVIVDNVGNHGLGDLREALKPQGILVMVGSTNDGNFIGPLWRPLIAGLTDPFVDAQLKGLFARLDQGDLITLAELMQAGGMFPEVGRVFDFEQLPQAIEHSESGHARGKIVLRILPP